MNQAINICITGLNNIGQVFWSYATGIFIQSSVLIILLVIIDLVLRRKVRAVFRYCLWMLVFVKLVLPASFTLPTGIGYWAGDYFKGKISVVKPVSQPRETIPTVININQGFAHSKQPAREVIVIPISQRGLVFLGWLAGMLILLVLLAQRIFFVRGLIARSRAANKRSVDILEECRIKIGIRQRIELRILDNNLSPAVCGLIRAKILIPATILERLSREKLKAVLIHELAHIKRGDIWVNMAATILQIVYFYNPLLWIANSMIRKVREQAVDEMVLVALKPETESYSNTLIDIAEMTFWRPSFSLRLTGVAESKKSLERRIKHMLSRPVPTSSKLGIVGLIAIIFIGAMVLPMGCNSGSKAVLQKPIVDKIDYPFVNDPEVIGGWKSVDFVRDIDAFNPTKKSWQGDLFLNNLIFEEGGNIVGNFLTWTKGIVINPRDKTASKYLIKQIDGENYMFFEWKSGDYTYRHQKPAYYVLKKVPAESLRGEPMAGKKADIPSTSIINEKGYIEDKVDYPFVDDPEVLGTWKSVDYVDEMEQFKVGEKQWKGRGGELFLNELAFLPNGRLIAKNDKVKGGYHETWTKGLVIYVEDIKTASKYTIKEIDGSEYMFFEWKSGDYSFRHTKPSYYVLKKESYDTGGLTEAWASQPSDAEFAKQLPAKIEKLNIDTAGLEQVKEIFGKPAQYIWGEETFTEDNLPRRYIMVYPSHFCIFMHENQIVELRHEHNFNYIFRDKLRAGSTLEEVFEVIGHPKKTVEGEKNLFEDGVLYKDIDGRKGFCYYSRSDQNVRLWFSDYKIIAIYMTRSDYYAGAGPSNGLIGLQLDENRWPVVNIIPGMPAAKAGLQDGDKILTVNDKDITHIATIRDALTVLHGEPGEKVKLTVQRGEQILTFEFERSKK